MIQRKKRIVLFLLTNLAVLVVPRVLAGFLMMPVLVMVFNMIGIFGAWVVCVQFLQLDHGIFVDKVRWFVERAVAVVAS